MLDKLFKVFPKDLLVAVAISALETVAKKTETTVDDKLVAAIKLAVANKDYGLQRKPTGPRNAASKKA